MKSTNAKLILDYVYEHEQTHPERIYLTQPFGGGQVIDYTWGQVMGEARRMASHLKSLGYEPGARIAMGSVGGLVARPGPLWRFRPLATSVTAQRIAPTNGVFT